jgi:hypothetical protein
MSVASAGVSAHSGTAREERCGQQQLGMFGMVMAMF